MKRRFDNSMLALSYQQHPVLFSIGVLYVLYAIILVLAIAGALIYDSINGGYEAFHLVYKMQVLSQNSL